MAKKKTKWSDQIASIKIKLLWPIQGTSILIKTSDLPLVKMNDLLYFDDRAIINLPPEIMLVTGVFTLIEEKSNSFNMGLITVQRRYGQSGIAHPRWQAEQIFRVIGTAYLGEKEKE